MPNETLYLGLKLSEFLTLIGIIIGPIAAVVITLMIEAKRRQRESKIQIMRMLLNTRHMVADPNYSTAINLIPIEFNRDKKVMDTWRAYIEHVRFEPSGSNIDGHNVMTVTKQTQLIFQVMRNLGFNLPETDIQTSAYASKGLVNRDNLYLESLIATKRIAEALEKQVSYVAGVSPSD